MDARKVRYGADDLPGLFKGAKRVVTGRGKKSQSFAIKADTDWEAVAKGALGPSGNLRAPTLRVGKTYLVGYCEPAWEEVFDEG